MQEDQRVKSVLEGNIPLLEDIHLERYIRAYEQGDLRSSRPDRVYGPCDCALGFMLREEGDRNSVTAYSRRRLYAGTRLGRAFALIEAVFEDRYMLVYLGSHLLDGTQGRHLIYDACKAELQRRSDLAIGKEVEALIEESSLVEVDAR